MQMELESRLAPVARMDHIRMRCRTHEVRMG